MFPVSGYVTNSAAIHIGSYRASCLSSVLYIDRVTYISKVELLSHRKFICLIVSTTEWFSKMVVQFIPSPLVYESSDCFSSLSALGIISYLMLAILVMYSEISLRF